jgi:hypothetical protein
MLGVDLHSWEESFLAQLEPAEHSGNLLDAVLVQEALGYLVQRPLPWEVALRVALVWRRRGGACASFWVAAPSSGARLRGLYGRAKQLPAWCWRKAGVIHEERVRAHVNSVYRACEGRAHEHGRAIETGKVQLSEEGELLLGPLVDLLFRGEVRADPVIYREHGDVPAATKRAFLLASAFCPARVFFANDSDLGALFGEGRAATAARRGKLLVPLGIKIGGMKGEDARQTYSEICSRRHSGRLTNHTNRNFEA